MYDIKVKTSPASIVYSSNMVKWEVIDLPDDIATIGTIALENKTDYLDTMRLEIISYTTGVTVAFHRVDIVEYKYRIFFYNSSYGTIELI